MNDHSFGNHSALAGVAYALGCVAIGMSLWVVLRPVTKDWMDSSHLTALIMAFIVGICCVIRFINNKKLRELEKGLEEHDAWCRKLEREHQETVDAHVAAVRRRRNG